MKFSLPIAFNNLDADADFVRFSTQAFNTLIQIINGQIDLVENCDTALVTVSFNSANVQQAIPHTLNQVPQGYFLVGSKAACQIYDGTTPNTNKAVYLRSTVATTAKILVF